MKDAARDEAAGAMAGAMASLARRSLSRAELDDKLRSRGFADDEIAAVLSRLTELKLIDDDALAERVAGRRFGAGRAGRFRVRAELRRRGVAEDVLERAIERTIPIEGERANARDELARFLRARNKRDEPREKARAAAFRHLVARGFPADLVRDLLGVSL